MFTALLGVTRYKNPTPNPLPASDEGAKMYLIRAETAVCAIVVKKLKIKVNTYETHYI